MAARFHVQVVTERLRPVDKSLPVLRSVLAAGVDTIRLRDEPAGIQALIKAWKIDRDWDRDRFVVSESAKVAGTFGVRWLNLPATWLDQTPPFGKFARIGMSVHSVSEAIEAESLGVDVLTFGHVFESTSHQGEPGRGLAALSEILDRVRIPVIAIGGITHRNVDEVLAAGVSGIAVISAVLGHADPGLAAARLVESVRESIHSPRIPLAPLPSSTSIGSSR
ncbi:MAG TPA: thiamine phosphate synthase [Thermomicrobiales bacterium]|nr:thiamine phosphate synthase [Thermomicrobiales bacterium]